MTDLDPARWLISHPDPAVGALFDATEPTRHEAVVRALARLLLEPLSPLAAPTIVDMFRRVQVVPDDVRDQLATTCADPSAPSLGRAIAALALSRGDPPDLPEPALGHYHDALLLGGALEHDGASFATLVAARLQRAGKGGLTRVLDAVEDVRRAAGLPARDAYADVVSEPSLRWCLPDVLERVERSPASTRWLARARVGRKLQAHVGRRVRAVPTRARAWLRAPDLDGVQGVIAVEDALGSVLVLFLNAYPGDQVEVTPHPLCPPAALQPLVDLLLDHATDVIEVAPEVALAMMDATDATLPRWVRDRVNRKPGDLPEPRPGRTPDLQDTIDLLRPHEAWAFTLEDLEASHQLLLSFDAVWNRQDARLDARQVSEALTCLAIWRSLAGDSRAASAIEALARHTRTDGELVAHAMHHLAAPARRHQLGDAHQRAALRVAAAGPLDLAELDFAEAAATHPAADAHVAVTLGRALARAARRSAPDGRPSPDDAPRIAHELVGADLPASPDLVASTWRLMAEVCATCQVACLGRDDPPDPTLDDGRHPSLWTDPARPDLLPVPAQRIDWSLAVEGVPTCDLLEGIDTSLGEAIASFTWALESGVYATWEAVIRGEQRLLAHPDPAAPDLFSFDDFDDFDDFENPDADERILTIDGLERPAHPWYQSLRTLADALLAQPLAVSGDIYEDEMDGWPTLVAAVEAHAGALERPEGRATPLEVLPQWLRDRLALRQALMGLVGWVEPLTEGSERLAAFLDDLSALRGPLERLGVRCVDLDDAIRSDREPTVAQRVADAWQIPLDARLADHIPNAGP